MENNIEDDRLSRSSPDEEIYVKHLPSKLGDLLPWYNLFYIIDYITIIITAIALYCIRFMHPSEAFADTIDRLPPEVVLEYYNYPKEDELWTSGREFALFIGVPLLTFILAQIWVRSLHDLHNAIMGTIQGWIIGSIFVELCKRFFGLLRPNYLERIDEYDDDEDTEFRDARMTFPSGHACSAMCTLFFTSLYLLGKLRPYDEKQGDGFYFQYLMIMFPTGLATYLSITRVTDYEHFISDLFAGWAIGIFFAFTCYCLVFYPPIWHKKDGQPKPKRSKNIQAVLMRSWKDGLPCFTEKEE